MGIDTKSFGTVFNAIQEVPYPLANAYYLDPTNGSDSNTGIASNAAFATFGKLNDVVFKRIKSNPTNVIVYLLSDCLEDVAMYCDWDIFQNFAAVTFDGSLGRVSHGTGTINTVTVANPAGPTLYQVNVIGMNWAPHVGRTCITQGNNEFIVLANLGGGTAHISCPHVVGSYDPTPSTVSPADTFTIYSFPQLGTSVEAQGLGGLGGTQMRFGASTIHAVVMNGPQCFFDTCSFGNIDTDLGSQAQVIGCYIDGSARAYSSSQLYLWAGGSPGSPIVHTNGLMDFSNWTCLHQVRSGSGGGRFSVTLGWLCVVGGGVRIGPGYEMLAVGDTADTVVFGTGVAGPRIIVDPGATWYYDTVGGKPNIGGTGVESQIGGANVNFAAWPTVTNTAVGGYAKAIRAT